LVFVDAWIGEKKWEVGIVIGQRKSDKVLTEDDLMKQTPETRQAANALHFNYSANPSRPVRPLPITEDSHRLHRRSVRGLVSNCL